MSYARPHNAAAKKRRRLKKERGLPRHVTKTAIRQLRKAQRMISPYLSSY